MGYHLTENELEKLFKKWSEVYDIFAPKIYFGKGRFSDTDCIRYGNVKKPSEVVFNKKSQYSFKECINPVSQTLFYFTENEIKEAEIKNKPAIIFMRSCDIHGLKRFDDMYLKNGPADYYYNKLRENIKIVLIGCEKSFENCFCVSMETNKNDNYDLSIDKTDDGTYLIDCKNDSFKEYIDSIGGKVEEVKPKYVTENNIKVSIPENLTINVAKSKMWNEYDSRCINCGRCNFVCPTCTCFTMQDIYYQDNKKVGERRRVWASCMVDGFTDVAGGGSYRKNNGQRMRFKVLHKILDYKQRNGYHMCVGCGRCDDICPEYISFSNCINKLEKAVTEVNE